MSRIFLRRGAVTLLLGLIGWAALTGPLDQRATGAVENGLSRALVAFALARGFNAVISAAQGTELSFTPAGVGVTLTPGEVLDPVNDLVERFSLVMLLSSVSLSAQRVLIELSAWMPFSIAVVLVCVLASLRPLTGRGPQGWLGRWLLRLAILLVAVRFLMPLTALLSESVYGQFLAQRHATAEQSMTRAKDEVDALNASREAAVRSSEAGLLDRAREWAGSARDRLARAADVERYKAAVENTARDTIELIVVFLLHTVAIPLALICALWAATRRLMLSLPPDHSP